MYKYKGKLRTPIKAPASNKGALAPIKEKSSPAKPKTQDVRNGSRLKKKTELSHNTKADVHLQQTKLSVKVNSVSVSNTEIHLNGSGSRISKTISAKTSKISIEDTKISKMPKDNHDLFAARSKKNSLNGAKKALLKFVPPKDAIDEDDDVDEAITPEEEAELKGNAQCRRKACKQARY